MAAVAAVPATTITAGTLQAANPVTPQAVMPAAKLAGSFQEFFAGAIQQTNGLQQQSDEMVRRLVSGDQVQLHDVMIAMQKAGLSFQMTMQVRNKVVEAYQEVMRMQI